MEQYHFPGSESRNHCVTTLPAMPVAAPGSAGTATGMAEPVLAVAGSSHFAADSAVPPYTDRGVHITIPLENRALVDWIAFTFKTVNDPWKVVEAVGLLPTLFTASPIGFSGYRKSLRFGNICIYFDGRDEMGCHVEMTGQGCRQFEAQFTVTPWCELISSVLSDHGKFTRLDLAIDNVDGALPLDRFYAALQDQKQIRTLFGEWRRIISGAFHGDAGIKGHTIYLGSTKSHVMFRVYDKAGESGIEGVWIRFELQLRDKKANEAAKLFTADGCVGTLATGIINNYFAIINDDDTNVSRCTFQPWWSAWLQSTAKISLSTEKSVKLVSETMEFIKRQYAPSLAMIKKHLGGSSSFNEYVNELLDDGNDRMTAKHDQILAASSPDKGNRRNKL